MTTEDGLTGHRARRGRWHVAHAGVAAWAGAPDPRGSDAPRYGEAFTGSRRGGR
jgi:hypothetical protein